jgi:hypothetical protein
MWALCQKLSEPEERQQKLHYIGVVNEVLGVILYEGYVLNWKASFGSSNVVSARRYL